MGKLKVSGHGTISYGPSADPKSYGVWHRGTVISHSHKSVATAKSAAQKYASKLAGGKLPGIPPGPPGGGDQPRGADGRWM